MNTAAMLVGSIALLSLERMFYVYVWRRPDAFRGSVNEGGLAPTSAAPIRLAWACVGFKMVQTAVFIFWCVVHGGGRLWPSPAQTWALGAGAALIVLGQVLNASVFWRLGLNGVFYGERFGLDLPRHSGFPYSLLAHPQYVGVVTSIWGLFLMLRFPLPDWHLLPVVETVLYSIGAHLEQ